MFNLLHTVHSAFDHLKNNLSVIYSIGEANSIANIVFEDKLGITKIKRISEPDLQLDKNEIQILESVSVRLLKNEPIQYVTEVAHFMDLELFVNENVLIPRPETEELVLWIYEEIKDSKIQHNILDIGTGSGCIAISLKKLNPIFTVFALDFSDEAIEVAKKNAKNLKLEIDFYQADILKIEKLNSKKFSLIVSNPPYVLESEKKLMKNNVLDFEPHTALFVSDNDPLLFYKSIAKFAFNNLEENGLLFFEINEKYGEEIVKMLIQKKFKNIELRKDFFGKDRMIKASKLL